LKKLGEKVIKEEEQLVESEINNFENSDLKLSHSVISEIKQRSKQRKDEFNSNFGLTSKDIKQDLEEIKMKFKKFNDRFDHIKNTDLEAKIKERINLNQRISKVDEKLNDIDIISRNLGEKINEMK